MNKTKIKIDVVSDVVCPWCYIGKRRLEKALQQLPDDIEVELEFLPFELNPSTPKAGVDQKAFLSKKFGDPGKYEQLTGHVTGIAKSEGIDFHYEKQSVMPNTFDAHRLIQFAKNFNKQPEVKEALMKAYFTDGVDLSKTENLVKIAESCGMEADVVRAFLQSEEKAGAVRSLEELNQQRGISGVPFYIIDNKYGVSGAQPSETFIEILTQVATENGN